MSGETPTIDREIVSRSLMEPLVAVDAEGQVAFANERFLTISQLTAETLFGAHYSLISEFVEDGFEEFREALEAVASGASSEERVELAMLHPEDAPVQRRLPAACRLTPVTVDGEQVGVLAVLRNISRRKEHERALQRSQRRFEAVLNSPDSFIGVLEPDGTLVEANRTALALIGAEPADVEGKPFWETPWWDHDEDLAAELREWVAKAADGEYVRFEAVHVSADGEAATVDGAIRPVTDADGDVVSLVAESRDVTKRHEYARALERKNERLEEFASVVSHDLRNPLNVAVGRLSLAMDECESDQLDEVARALDRMEGLISDLLALAREGREATDLERVDLAALLEVCWRNVDTGEASLVLETDRTVEADRSRLQQALENLVRNAMEHAGDGVTVTVGDLDDGFFVEDDGPGIPAEERSDVFDFGYSTTPDGTGLGLSIVQEIAGAHGWDVTATAGANGGARFEFRDVEPAG